MTHKYAVAQNIFSVTLPDHLAAWATLQPRFEPFETDSGQEPILKATVATQPLAQCVAHDVYEPDHAGIGFITSRVYRLANGGVTLDFKHVSEPTPRLRMTLTPELDKADITFDPAGDDSDHYFLTHALMIAYMLATCGNGTLMFHSSAVILDGRAYLFQGKSGTGKSTHARMWTQSIPGAELLNDDNPLVRISPDGNSMAYGSPWSGKTHCYRNEAAPVGAFVRIVRADHNRLEPLRPLQAYASLTSSVFYTPFLSPELREARHKAIERLVAQVPCCQMHCQPTPDAALTCMNQLLIG